MSGSVMLSVARIAREDFVGGFDRRETLRA